VSAHALRRRAIGCLRHVGQHLRLSEAGLVRHRRVRDDVISVLRMQSPPSPAEAYERARSVWPQVRLSLEDFLRHAARPQVGPQGLAERPEDLFLAFACLEGDPAALAHFEATHLAKVPRFLARYQLPASEVDEVVQRVRIRLLLGEEARLTQYGGQGAFGAWVRVAAQRVALNFIEETRGGVRSDSLLSRVPALADGPELAVLKHNDGKMLSEALGAALQALSAQEKTVLRLHYLDDLGIDEIGRVMRVHRATVARWLIAIRSRVEREIRARFKLDHRMSSARLRSFLALLREDVALSLDRVLRASR